MGNDRRYGVSFTLMNGSETSGSNLWGYCKSHHGLLSYPLARTHRCMCREKDGGACRHLCRFERYDTSYQSALKGEEFRESLGKHGKRKGERKKRASPYTDREVIGVPDSERGDNTFGCMVEVRDLQAVRSDIRPERTGMGNRVNKDYCKKCFWRKMLSRVIQTYVCSGNK